MTKGKNICVVVKAPWYIRGEYRHMVVMDGEFVAQVQVGDEIGSHLLFHIFVPFDKVVSLLDDKTKIEFHQSAKRKTESDSNVNYADALQSTYVDRISRLTWLVTKRKWCLNLGNGENFLEITIGAEDYSNKE
ncbi:MAG: hypothetical protein J6D52_04415 [Clostridia bacterium]|nr:hypothetical protein [Clostridia bacterium]